MSAKKAKKELTKTQKIVNIVVMAIELVIIVACIALSITVIVGSKSTTEELGSGYNITVVLSDSMDGNVKGEYNIDSFAAGDLLIIKSLSDEEKGQLKVGDVVTYTSLVSGRLQLVTHRIVSIESKEVSGTEIYYYTTQGDKYEDSTRTYAEGNIKGLVLGVVPKVGYVINWFQQSTNFLLSVVIPLALLLVYNVYLFIKMIIAAKFERLENKSQKEIEAAKLAAREELLANETILDEEAIKKKAIEEYLAKMKQDQGNKSTISDSPQDEN